MKKLAIYIVDDHSLFREGLHFLLSNLDFSGPVYEAGNGAEFLAGLDQHPTDVALVDIEMPGMNGMEATRRALQKKPDLKIIALSMYSDESYYTSMIEAGASGFLLKNSGFNEVKKAIQQVYEGNTFFSMDILQSFMRNMATKNRVPNGEPLTDREKEILIYICQGLTNADIADTLNLSKRTIDKHRENLLLKTHSKNTANLVIYAVKNGFYNV